MGLYTQIFIFIALMLLAFLLGQLSYFALFRLFKNNRSKAKQIGRVLNYAFFIAFLYVGITFVLNQNIDSFVAAAGIIGIAVALASQQTASNVLAGIITGFQKSLSEGDIIELDGKMGQVKDINLLSVEMKTFDGKITVIPKAYFVSNPFTNYSTGKVLRLALPLQVSTKADIKKINAILMDICLKDPNVLPEIPYETTFFEKILQKETEKKTYNPDVVIKGVSADFYAIELRVWIHDIKNKDKIASDLFQTIFEKFRENKIELRPGAGI